MPTRAVSIGLTASTAGTTAVDFNTSAISKISKISIGESWGVLDRDFDRGNSQKTEVSAVAAEGQGK